MKRVLCIAFFSLLMGLNQSIAEEVTSISQYGITWTFDKKHEAGQFATGDYWVLGPVNVIGITTDLHAPGFTPGPGQDGSMVNPGIDDKQGYDNRLSSYDATRNASIIGGKPVAADNPLVLTNNASLVSMVSWLCKSDQDTEPGTPKFDAGRKGVPRPATRRGAILTVLSAAPPNQSFRPPYAGDDKTVKFNINQLDPSKLKNLPPVADTPDPRVLAKQMERPWLDHVHQYLGSMVHPSENMPDYGQQMGHIMVQVSLLLQLDFSKMSGKPTKDKLLIELVQYGIDLAGIADHGGGWPANGGHHMGRKWPILFAGVMLNDAHMSDVGNWKTCFQEDEDTFYVSQREVEITNGPKWNPDKRGGHPEAYSTNDIGMAEWGICHATKPAADNRDWLAIYRSTNNSVYPGFVLAARIMGLEKAWNHPALFDYTDRLMNIPEDLSHPNRPLVFVVNMWKAYGVQKTTADR